MDTINKAILITASILMVRFDIFSVSFVKPMFSNEVVASSLKVISLFLGSYKIGFDLQWQCMMCKYCYMVTSYRLKALMSHSAIHHFLGCIISTIPFKNKKLRATSIIKKLAPCQYSQSWRLRTIVK